MSSPNFAPQLMNYRFSFPMGFKQRTNITHGGEEYLSRQGLDQFDSSRVTIESLPVEILLDIFYLYQRGPYGYAPHRWRNLVHVCRRWRYIVFAFPHRLDLYLECNANTRVRRTLDVWPCLPIIVRDTWTLARKSQVDNIIAALERHDRVCIIDLECPTRPLLEHFSTAMQVPFPALTFLKLEFGDKSVPPPVLDTFLGGFAPHLQRLILGGIPVPVLPKVLPSCQDLVEVRLNRIPNTGYISPEAMATSLSALSQLEILHIGFKSPASCPDRHALPSTRVILPALTDFEFHGDSEYFEDLIARIDTPTIRSVQTEFFNQLVFDNQQFRQFVGRTKLLRSFKRANLFLDRSMATILLYDDLLDSPINEAYDARLHIRILCNALDWQVSGLAQICADFSTFLSNVERCSVARTQGLTVPHEDMDHTEWQDLFRPFTSVRSLGISSGLEGLIAPALQELTGDRVMEVLPMLRTLRLPLSRLSSETNPFEPFITTRQLSNHPIALENLTSDDDIALPAVTQPPPQSSRSESLPAITQLRLQSTRSLWPCSPLTCLVLLASLYCLWSCIARGN